MELQGRLKQNDPTGEKTLTEPGHRARLTLETDAVKHSTKPRVYCFDSGVVGVVVQK